MRTINMLVAALSLGLALAATAAAPAPTTMTKAISLELKSAVEEVYKNEKGEMAKRLVPPTKIVPGDELVYTINYSNTSKQVVSDVVVHDPIPTQVAYKDDSAFGTGTEIEFSVDGGKTWGKPDALKVKGADGKPRAATGSDYTHVRWKLLTPVAPGAKGFVRFRAVLR